MRCAIGLVGLVLVAGPVRAETGAAAWLRYERIPVGTFQAQYYGISGPIVALDDSPVIRTARDELNRGFISMLDRPLGSIRDAGAASIVIGTADSVRRALPRANIPQLS